MAGVISSRAGPQHGIVRRLSHRLSRLWSYALTMRPRPIGTARPAAEGCKVMGNQYGPKIAEHSVRPCVFHKSSSEATPKLPTGRPVVNAMTGTLPSPTLGRYRILRDITVGARHAVPDRYHLFHFEGHGMPCPYGNRTTISYYRSFSTAPFRDSMSCNFGTLSKFYIEIAD